MKKSHFLGIAAMNGVFDKYLNRNTSIRMDNNLVDFCTYVESVAEMLR